MNPPDRPAKHALAVPAALAIAVVAAAAWPGAFEALAWDRAAARAGEWWRAVTGQFVHLGPGHAAMNLAGLAVLAAAFRDEFGAGAWAGAFAASLAGVAAGLVFGPNPVDWYAGLSGALHGVLGAGAVGWIRRGRRAGWLLVAALAGKLAWETLAGASSVSTWLTGGPVLVAAHAWGAAGGVAYALAVLAVRGRAGPGGYNAPPRPGLPGGAERTRAARSRPPEE